MFLTVFIRFLKFYGKDFKPQLYRMLAFGFLTSFFEFASVAIILPFLIMLIEPKQMTSNFFLRAAQHYLHLPNEKSVFAFAAIILIVMVIAKNIYSVFLMYKQNKIMKDWALHVKEDLMKHYLYAPYEDNVKAGDSEKFFTISAKVEQIFDLFVFKVIIFLSNTAVVALIFCWMIYLLPKYTIAAAVFFIVSASLQNRIFYRMAKRYADERHKITVGAYETVMSSIKCIKEIKINGCEEFFYNVYKKISEKLIPLSEKINLLPIIPQYVIEIIFVFTIILLFLGIFKEYNGQTTGIMIAFGVVAMCLYRIIPLIYKSQVCINYIDIYKVYVNDLIDLSEEYKKYDSYISDNSSNRIKFESQIELAKVSYSYDKVNPALFDFNVSFKKGEYIGIIGLSGAGKTTFVDVLAGLLIPTGEISVDGVRIEPGNIKSFQNIIGYVSQNTNTVDGSIAKNVAWGIDENLIDSQRVIEALKEAKLYNQVLKMPMGIETPIHKDGTGLSQGQKQRIGIARAFYRNPEILILDEATSSLDVKTESELVEILNTHKGEITVFAISHRVSTLKYCDRIMFIDEGKLVDIGSLKELSAKYRKFNTLIKLSNFELEKIQQVN